MPRNPKLFIKGTLVELSSRVESGLPFAPNNLTKKLIENILARAQSMYPVTIVAYVIMSNHFHIMIVVKDPSDVPKFVEYFKRETAYIVNRLKGRIKKTVWSDGYDHPVILDPETAINRLKYIHLNPNKAGLVEDYNNWLVSSLNINGKSTNRELTVKRIPRNNIPKLPNKNLTLKEINNIAESIMDDGSEELFTLKIEPDAWIQCFNETKNINPAQLREYLEQEIKKDQEFIIKNLKFPIPAIEKVQTQNIRTHYIPKKFSKRMICLAKNKQNRIKYISWFRNYCKNLPCFLKRISKNIIFESHYPPGFFAPGGFLSANLLPQFTPTPLIA